MSDMLTFEIDLNMLRDGRTRSHIEFMRAPSGHMRAPEPGELVWAIDEDAARYLAVIEQVSESGFVDLLLKLETRVHVDFELKPVVTAFVSTDPLKTYTAGVTAALSPVP